MLLIVFLTLLGISGACAGVLISRQIGRVHQLTSITGGLFLGMAAFLIVPEAFESGPWPIVTMFLLAGCISFAWLENTLDHSLHGANTQLQATRLATIFSVIAIHNALDGWNMGIALQVSSGEFARAFSLGMGIHKCVGGLAIGAILRRASVSTVRNLMVAATAEAITFLGAVAERGLIAHIGQGWTVWFLAATGGSFLFLAFHSFAEAKRGVGLNHTIRFGALGFAVVATAALFPHH
jgi:zinc transporter ZupT